MYETFWELSPKKLRFLTNVNELEEKKKNHGFWIQGIYIKRAIESVFSNEAEYPTEPIDFWKEPETSEQMFERFGVMASKFNSDRAKHVE